MFLCPRTEAVKFNQEKTNNLRFFPARDNVLITVFSKLDRERKSQPVNDLMLTFPSQSNCSLSSGFSVERLRQVLLIVWVTPVRLAVTWIVPAVKHVATMSV